MAAQRPSLRQLQGLIEFLEQRRIKFRGTHGRGLDVPWSEISDHLNAMGGALLSDEEWQKFWTAKKLALKRRATAALRESIKTGSGRTPRSLFSDLEKRVFRLMRDGRGPPDKGIAVPAFPRLAPASSPAAPAQVVVRAQAPTEEIAMADLVEEQQGPELERLVEEPFRLEGGLPHQNESETPEEESPDSEESASSEEESFQLPRTERGRLRETDRRRSSAFVEVKRQICDLEDRRAAAEEKRNAHLEGIAASLRQISASLGVLAESSQQILRTVGLSAERRDDV